MFVSLGGAMCCWSFNFRFTILSCADVVAAVSAKRGITVLMVLAFVRQVGVGWDA